MLNWKEDGKNRLSLNFTHVTTIYLKSVRKTEGNFRQEGRCLNHNPYSESPERKSMEDKHSITTFCIRDEKW